MINFLGRKTSLANARERVERTQILETWHWNRARFHDRAYDKYRKLLVKAKETCKRAEAEFITHQLSE